MLCPLEYGIAAGISRTGIAQQGLKSFGSRIEVALIFQHSKGSGMNGAKLVGIWDDFRRPLFDVGGGPFLCGVLSSIGSSLGGVF